MIDQDKQSSVKISRPGGRDETNKPGLSLAINAGIVLLLALVLTGCATQAKLVSSSPGTTFGKIYVDTPEVYSRERLVNDRFQQDAWLREKLNKKQVHGVQGSAGVSSRSNTTIALAAGTKPQTPSVTNAEKPETSKDLADTAIEQFRDDMAYREEVRNEILENQLDDRHDIAGNTLYRLKFDATVLPLHDTSAYAMVEVTLTGSSFSDPGKDDEAVLTATRESKDDWEERTGIFLPEWRYGKYVAGLDEASISYYTRVYENWMRDMKNHTHTEEDILFGNLQKYFEASEYDGHVEILENDQCEGYRSNASREAARKELIARGVPGEYIQARTYTEEMTAGDFVQITTSEMLCVQTGLANFIHDVRELDTVIYTYAVTPKERVQRVYGNTLDAGAVGVSVGAEQGALGASLAHSSALEARANAIMRQPQLVGYSPEAHRPDEATMGWLIGPRYKISDDSDGPVSFRHVPTQHTLTGIISVPSWWTELRLVTRTYWLENGVEYSTDGRQLSAGVESMPGKVATITLPGDFRSFEEIFDPKGRGPRVETPEDDYELWACEKGTVIIRGSQLWRSTVVTLGGQQADSILVLPNMEGVVATFNPVAPPATTARSLDIWTSEGEAHVSSVTIGDSGACDEKTIEKELSSK
jgi:hypothetical protein